MAQMCLVSDSAVPEGWAGTFITPFRPSGGLMSSVLLTEFMGEFSWKYKHTHTHRGQNTDCTQYYVLRQRSLIKFFLENTERWKIRFGHKL